MSLLEAGIVAAFIMGWSVVMLPLLQVRTQTLRLSNLPIAASLGVLLAGFSYALVLKFGLNASGAMWLILALLAGFSVLLNRKLSRPSLKINWGWGWFWNPLFLVCIGGFTLVASLKMGSGDYPPLFFNDDSSLRLGHAFSLLRAETYPPENIFVSNTTHAYHYGAPASVAALSLLSGVPPHKVMFWVLCPLLITGIVAQIIQITVKIHGTGWRQRISVALFLPYVMLGSMTFSFINSDALETGQELLGQIGSGLFRPHNYDALSFGNGVWDASMLAGVFLLLVAVRVLYQRNGRPTYSLTIAVAALTLICKLDMAPAIFTILAIALVFKTDTSNVWPSLLVIAVLALLPPTLFLMFGYGEGRSETSTLSLRSIDEAVSFFDWRWTRTREFLIEIAWVLIALAIILLDGRKNLQARSQRSILAVGVAAATIVSYLIVAVVFVPKTGVQFTLSMWIGVACLGTCLLSVRRRWFKPVALVILAPIVVVAVFGQLRKVEHAFVAIASPGIVEEYVENHYIGEAMRKIPLDRQQEMIAFSAYVDSYLDLGEAYEAKNQVLSKEEWGKQHYKNFGQKEGRILPVGRKVVVVTNDFRYSKWDDTQPQLVSMFGHRTYSTHPRLFPGRRGFNERAAKRVDLQKQMLSRRFSNESPDAVRQTLNIAHKKGWTHYLMRKDLDDGLPPIDPAIIPLPKIFENEIYVVYEFRL